MEGGPSEGIYRAMIKDADGMPMLGLAALKLGIRRGVDIVPDQLGHVHLPLFVPGEANGLSCSPTVQDLPAFALPVGWGGPNPKTTVWLLRSSDLPQVLVAREDTLLVTLGRHICIGTSRTMTFDDYLRAVQSTRSMWSEVTKTEDAMDFKHEFLTALGAGRDYQTLMELVRRHRAQGVSIDTAYQALHQIWLEHCFDNAETGAMQDTLEAVMEKVWYGQPVV
jgi:hypothetical protein